MKTVEKQQTETLKTEDVPQHPFMAPNNRSNVHCDAYMTDSFTCPGPKGSTNFQRFSLPHDELKEKCITILVEMERNNYVTLGSWEDNNSYNHELLLLNRNDGSIIANISIPSTNLEGSGAYFYLDNSNQVVVGIGNLISIYEIDYSHDVQFVLKAKEKVDSDNLVSFLPDWYGNLWYVGSEGIVGVIEPGATTGASINLGENIANSLAVDETGGVFIVSCNALYRFDFDKFSSTNSYTWRCKYDNGSGIKPGQYVQGSGTTPTLLNEGNLKLVAITDNADPKMHVVVYKRNKEPMLHEERILCKVPVFPKEHSCTENSLIGVEGTFIVENNYGYTFKTNKDYYQPKQTSPGLARVCGNKLYSPLASPILWDNKDISVPSVVSKVSITDRLVYTYNLKVIDKADHWFFTVLSLDTGEILNSIEVGHGPEFNNHYSGITLDPSTYDALIPVIGGILKISND